MVERGSSKAQARVRFSHTAPALALVAQWSEQSAHNRLVGGSNPSGGTTYKTITIRIYEK